MDGRGDTDLGLSKKDYRIIQRPHNCYNDVGMCEFSSGHLSRAGSSQKEISQNKIIENKAPDVGNKENYVVRPCDHFNYVGSSKFMSGHLSQYGSSRKKPTKKDSLDDKKRKDGYVNPDLNGCKSKKSLKQDRIGQGERYSKCKKDEENKVKPELKTSAESNQISTTNANYEDILNVNKNTVECNSKPKKKESNATEKKGSVNNQSKVDSNNNSKIKANRIEHLTPVTKFFDNVREIFPEDVSGVKNIDDWEGEAAVRQQNDLDELLLELEQVGFKTAALRRPMAANNPVSSNSKGPYQLDVPPQHKITNEEKVQYFLDNMESSSQKWAYESNPRLYNIDTLSSSDSFHTANELTTSQASISTTLSKASQVSMAQEFLYKDDEEGVSLVEVHLPSVLGLDELHKASEEESREKSSAWSCETSFGSTALRDGLREFGEAPLGPITQTTRRVYLLRLRKFRQGLIVPRGDTEAKFSGFSGPMAQSLKNISCVSDKWADLWELEKQMSSPFSSIDSQTVETVNFLARDAAVKSSFNYLLLDPRLTQNLPSRAFSMGVQELWRIFISALFYIGKGTRSRPFQHFYEATKKKGKKGTFGETIATIHDIWEGGMGVISLQVFQNSIGVEGLTREAAMIQAMGCSNLCNAKRGAWYGPAKDWSKTKQNLLGTFLLFKAFNILLQEGERQIRPEDLKMRSK